MVRPRRCDHSCQTMNPLAVDSVRLLPTRNPGQFARIHQRQIEPMPLQNLERRDPVNSGALQRNRLCLSLLQPRCHLLQFRRRRSEDRLLTSYSAHLSGTHPVNFAPEVDSGRSPPHCRQSCFLVFLRSGLAHAVFCFDLSDTSTSPNADSPGGRSQESALEECCRSLANVYSPSRNHAYHGAFAPLKKGF